jgi:hypothetical protein
VLIENSEPNLLVGERVVWRGTPYSGLLFRSSEIFLIPFSLFWGGFAIFWNVSVWTTEAPFEFKLFGLPFLVVGIYVMIGRFVIDARIRDRMAYFVTDKRILICRQGKKSSTKSVDLRRLPGLELDEGSDGTGTIRFGSSNNWFSGNNFGIWQPSFDPTPQFIRIPNARSVFELIQKQSDN